MTTSTTTRRAILASAAALPALAAPTLAEGLTPDPIFAAIERHKAGFLRRYEVAEVLSGTIDNERCPDYNEAVYKAADTAAHDAHVAAAFALTEIRPTTMAGLLALIDHIDAFNHGHFGASDGWRSEPLAWPNAALFNFDDDGIDDPNRQCGMAYAVLLNVRAALATLAVQS